MQDTHPEGRKFAVTAVCFAVPILVVFAALNGYQTSVLKAGAYPDTYGVAGGEIRLAPVLDRVPATAQIGYFSDLPVSGSAYPAALLAAQHALAPRQMFVLGEGISPEWAVGNFSHPMDFAAMGAERGYEMVADLGNGVILYHRKATR